MAQTATASPEASYWVGQPLVYPPHGVMTVEDVVSQEVAGITLELLRLVQPRSRLQQMIPTTRLREAGLRPLATPHTVEQALQTLISKPQSSTGRWIHREKALMAKLNTGDLIAVAEVTRDTAQKEGERETSYSERQIYTQAEQWLCDELAALSGQPNEDVRHTIQRVIAEPKAGHGLKLLDAIHRNGTQTKGEALTFTAPKPEVVAALADALRQVEEKNLDAALNAGIYAEVAKLEQALAKADKELEELKKQAPPEPAAGPEAIRTLTDRIRELEHQTAEQKAEIQAQTATTRSDQKALTSARSTIATLTNQLEAAKAEAAAAETNTEALQEKDEQIDALTKRLVATNDTLSQTEQELREARAARAVAVSQAEQRGQANASRKQAAEIVGLRAEIASTAADRDRFEQQATSLKAQLADLKSQHADVEALRERVQQLETQLAEVESKLTEQQDVPTEAEFDKVQAEIMASISAHGRRVAQLHQTIERLASENARLNRKIEKLQR